MIAQVRHLSERNNNLTSVVSVLLLKNNSIDTAPTFTKEKTQTIQGLLVKLSLTGYVFHPGMDMIPCGDGRITGAKLDGPCMRGVR